MFRRWGRRLLCGSNICLPFGAASELRAIFRASKLGLRFPTNRSMAVPLLRFFFICASVASYVAFCFVISWPSSLLVLVPRESCASWLWHFLYSLLLFEHGLQNKFMFYHYGSWDRWLGYRKASFVHMVHICWALSVRQIIERISLKTEGIKIKS